MYSTLETARRRRRIIVAIAKNIPYKTIAYNEKVTSGYVSRLARQTGFCRRVGKNAEPTKDTTIHLFISDIAKLKSKLGRGWSGMVRHIVRKHLEGLDNERPENVSNSQGHAEVGQTREAATVGW